jgi:hypothetical protein
VTLRASLIAILLAASCEPSAVLELAARPGAGARPAGESTQCLRDDDCALLPSALTCCVECPPAPPFEPAPSWVLGGMLIQLETDCAQLDRACPEVRCEPVPAGCVARAACVNGRCVAVSSGCGTPTS